MYLYRKWITNIQCKLIHLAKNGLGDQLQNILVNIIEPTREEEGNIAYVLHRSMDNPDELMFDEI
jgi:quinol monooxygenase YgiN